MEMMPGNNQIEKPEALSLDSVTKMLSIRKIALELLERRLGEARQDWHSQMNPEETKKQAESVENLEIMRADAKARIEELEKQKTEFENKNVDGKDLKLAA